MSAPPRRIVTGHDAEGRSVVLSDAPTPKTLDIGTAAFHEVWITDETPSPIAASEPEPTDRPVRMMFVLIDGAITDDVRGSAGPLEFFDQVLG
jgi:hypothetical protein